MDRERSVDDASPRDFSSLGRNPPFSRPAGENGQGGGEKERGGGERGEGGRKEIRQTEKFDRRFG